MASPNVSGASSRIYAISAISSSDVWAVGYSDSGSGRRTLALHWNGAQWGIIASPNVGAGNNTLRGVTAISSGNVWAVGDYYNSGGTLQTLTMRWNGAQWSVVSSPNPGSGDNSLNAVDGLGSGEVWAAGAYNSNGVDRTLTMRWNGSSWSVTASPNGGDASSDNELKGLAAISSGDVWAAGDYYASSGSLQTLALHWNGSAWSLAFSPSPGPGDNSLAAVAGTSSGDVWAAGYYADSSGTGRTLIEHWNGSGWSSVPSPNAGQATSDNLLDAITAASSGDAWAAGYYVDATGTNRTLVERWNGAGWSVVSSPSSQPGGDQLRGVSATSSTDVWAAGFYESAGSGQTMVERYNPCPPSPPTDTPVPPPTGVPATPPPAPTSAPTNPPSSNTPRPQPTSASTPAGPTEVPTLPPPTPLVQAVWFPETHHWLKGQFLDYWRTHGGLMQQGYPITEEFTEVSDLNGKPYTVQYFERAVFEKHPENKPPFDVLLSQLGRFYYRDKYPKGAPNQVPNKEPGSVSVPETGKRLGGLFLQYWQANGGLMQQGYPISDEFTEISDLDGKPYKVQYFERAVFEYHPEIQDPRFKVLLSQLGTFRYRCKYQGGPCSRR